MRRYLAVLAAVAALSLACSGGSASETPTPTPGFPPVTRTLASTASATPSTTASLLHTGVQNLTRDQAVAAAQEFITEYELGAIDADCASAEYIGNVEDGRDWWNVECTTDYVTFSIQVDDNAGKAFITVGD